MGIKEERVGAGQKTLVATAPLQDGGNLLFAYGPFREADVVIRHTALSQTFVMDVHDFKAMAKSILAEIAKYDD